MLFLMLIVLILQAPTLAAKKDSPFLSSLYFYLLIFPSHKTCALLSCHSHFTFLLALQTYFLKFNHFSFSKNKFQTKSGYFHALDLGIHHFDRFFIKCSTPFSIRNLKSLGMFLHGKSMIKHT